MRPELNQTPETAPAAKVLVVDDEACVVDLVSRWLTATGFSCAGAKDAQEAWAYLQLNVVDLVCTDINMPGGSGLKLLRQIRQSQPDTVVLVLTAIGEISTATTALHDGASSYLLKPIRREELVYHVRTALEKRQLLLERRQYTQQLEQTVDEQTQLIRRAHEETILRLLSALSFRDYETGAHIRRTGLFSEMLARAAGWDAVRAEQIRMAAPMHDLGKIGIADAILRKPGELNAWEFETMKTHTLLGAQILENSDTPVLLLAQQIALCHHEWWNGRGYPHGVSGLAIPESARIVAIVDVYDALSHDRIYRPAFSRADVLCMMHDARGTHLDPYLLGRFLSVLPEIEAITQAHPDRGSLRSFDPSFWATSALESPRSPSPRGDAPHQVVCK